MVDRGRRAVLIATAFVVLAGFFAHAAAAQNANGELEVRVAAQLLADGRTEFALQERNADGSWAERRLPRARFFPANPQVGRWLSSSPLAIELFPDSMDTADDKPDLEVRVAAQLLADGRTEFALQERNADGSWAERRLPRARFFPANPQVDRWLSSSPLLVKAIPIEQLSTAEIYALVSPSVAFIETTAATGSGILISGGYVVTNYHVVWPYEAVWVVFPDGTELANVPVVGWDPMADLAVLGPVEVSAEPLRLENGEGAALGSELLLVGYPAEVDLFPQPTITRGILSRFREWERLGMTYLQTDAAIAGGQSGGALVNDRGGVVGISTYSFSEANFGLAASSADILPIVEELIEGEFTSGLGDRRLPVGRGSLSTNVHLRNFWDTQSFVLDTTAGIVLEVELEGSGDGWFQVSNAFGTLLEVDHGYTGVEYGAVELLTSGVHFLQVEMASGDSSSFELSSNVRFKPFNDPDDGRTVTVGNTYAGNIDRGLST